MATVTGTKRHLGITSDTYDSNGDVVVGGNLTVEGTTTTLDTANLLVEDKNIIIGNVSTPSDTTADGGGITLKGASDYTINWVNANDRWEFNQGIYSSGPITSAGQITGTELEGTSLDINGNADISGNLSGVDTLTATTLSVTNYGLASGDIPNNAADTTGNAATVTSIGNLTGHITSANRVTSLGSFTTAELNAAISNGSVLTAEADTLDSVTDRGASTTNNISVGTIGSGAITSTGKIQGTELEGTSLDINGAATFDTNVNSGGFIDHKNSNAGSAAYTSLRIQSDVGGAEIWRNSSTRTQTGGAAQSFNIYNNQDTNIWSGGTRALHLNTSQNAIFAGDVSLTNGSLSITSDGSNAVTFTESGNGDFTIDAPDDIRLDAGGGDIVLRTGGTEFGRISSFSNALRLVSSVANEDILLMPNGTGNVGIGTTNPSALLHVGNDYTIPSGYTGINTVLNGGVFINIFEEATKVFGIWHDPNGEAILQIDTDPTNLFLIDPTGDNEIKVGIGTSSPSSKLEVYASGSTVLDIQGSQGQLFSITDDLTGDLFTVSDISGVPIFNVNASGTSNFDGNLNLGDNNKIQLGASQDLQIYHDGSNSYIKDAGTGDLIIDSGTLKLRNEAGDKTLIEASSTAVELYHNNVKKLHTTTTGVTVTGELEATSLDINGNADISGNITMAANATVDGVDISALPTTFAPTNAEQNVQSDWNATSGDALILNKPTIPTDHGDHDGLYLPIGGGTLTGNLNIPEYLYHAGDTNTYLRFREDDLQLVAGGRNIIRMDEGTDPDKVQLGDSSTVTYTEGLVGIGTPNPSHKLDIDQGELRISNDQLDPQIILQGADMGKRWVLSQDEEDNIGSTGFYIAEGTNVDATDALLYLTPGGDLGIGTTGPSSKLEVDGDIKGDSFSSDGNARSYTWRALQNTAGGTNFYHRIARITGTQSTRFIIELAGRFSSYSDGSIPAYGKLVGQFNNDNNYDLVYYDFTNGVTGTSQVVTKIGQVDVSTTVTDIYINNGQFSEITATAHISDGSITPYDSSNGSTSAPAGYTDANKAIVWNSTNNSSLVSSLISSFPKGSTTNYTSAATSGTDAWYKLFQIQDNNSCPIECHIRSYAHTSLSFIASEGYAGGDAHINILDAHVSSVNSAYKFIEGVRITASGVVEILLNGGSTVQVEMTLLGDAIPYSSLEISTETSGNIKDSVTSLSTGMIRAYGDVNVGENLSYTKPTANNQFRGEIVTFGGQSSIAIGDIVYLNTSGNWAKAQANSDTTSKSLLGVAMGTTAAAGILLRGFARSTNSFSQSISAGLPFYLSTGTAGDAQVSVPTTPGHVARIVGYGTGVSAEMYFCPDNTFVEIA